ncbi:MAG TPA: HlyD family efflux transporter periplasmic adaptor subunit [Allosphingosinicella sp.]|jgi:membrane fusion protein
MNSPLFRQEVIEAGRDRLAGTVVAATPPRSRVYATLLMLVFLALVLILVFGQHAAREQVRGTVSYDAGIARVYPNAPAEIRQVHVRTGQYVNAGDPLVTVSLAQGRGGIGSQLGELARQDAELARQLELSSQLGSAETQALDRQRASLTAAIGSLERQRSFAAGQIGLAEAAVRRAARLAAEGAGSQRQVEEQRAAVLARRAEVESINERVINQQEALRAIDAQILQRRIAATQSGSQLSAQRAALAEQRAALVRTDQLTLTAPVAGEVGDVSVQIGQRARPETSLVTIVPRGSQIEVWLYAPSRAVGFVRVGQEVRLQFDAFPYQKYGAGRGTVTAVSRVPIEASAIDPALEVREPVFRIRVRIDEVAPRVSGAESRLRPGMTLTANLVLERRRLWEVLFNPIAAALRT